MHSAHWLGLSSLQISKHLRKNRRAILWAFLIFIPILITVIAEVAAHFITRHPEEATSAVRRFFLGLSQQTWLRYTAFFLGGLVAGLWLDWFLRKLDGYRAKEIRALGDVMIDLARAFPAHVDT